MTDAQASAVLKDQIRKALEWLEGRPDNPAIRELIATYKDAIK